MSVAEELREHLKRKGYEYLDAGRSREWIGRYLSECCNSYESSSIGQGQNSDNTGHPSNTPDGVPITQPFNIKIEQKSGGGFDFWDIILLSCLWGRGNTTNVYNYTPSINRRNGESDDRVLGPCIAVFCLIFIVVMSYFLLAYAAYKIKNAKLENNKYCVPIALFLGIFSFSVSATLILLLSDIIIPNLEYTMRISSEAFTGFQVIIGLNAVIFGLGAILFCYLAVDKANKKSLVDNEVDRIINYRKYQPGYTKPSSKGSKQKFYQHERYQDERCCEQPDYVPLSSSGLPRTEYADQIYDNQLWFDALHGNGYWLSQQNPQPRFNNPDVAQYDLGKTSHPS